MLSQRALNRATLARQMLLDRQRIPPLLALRQLAGLQAQAPNPPYLALLARLEGFKWPQLTRLVETGKVVRMAMHRSTLHLVPADEALSLRAALHPVQVRTLKSSHGRQLQQLDLDALCCLARQLLTQSPLTNGELGRALKARWPERDADALAAAARNLLPLMHCPPAGTWGHHAHARLALCQASQRANAPQVLPIESLVRRYLAAFGPARAADMSVWSGLTQLAPAFEALRPSLRSFVDEQGRELFDLPRAPRPDASTPAPARLLGEWEGLLLSYEDRTRFLQEEHRAHVFTNNGIVRGTAWCDGRVAGTWRITEDARRALLAVRLFDRQPRKVREALADESRRVLLAAHPALRHEVTVACGD
jgi:Winged helix DNA-binding domain